MSVKLQREAEAKARDIYERLRRGVQHQFAEATGRCAVQQAGPADAGEIRQREKDFDGGGCIGRTGGGSRSSAAGAGVPATDEVEIDLCGCIAALIRAQSGRVHTTFGQTGTATGRLSSTNPNLQNIPIRTELGREIRAAFIAEPGHVLLAADYSQIELRLLAHYSKDKLLVEAFRRGDDIHTLTASQVFGVPPLMVTPEHRRGEGGELWNRLRAVGVWAVAAVGN
jgi:hypothetical protein